MIIQQKAELISKAGAAIAVAPFLSSGWWSENYYTIIAIVAVVGCLVSVAGFVTSQVYAYKRHRREDEAHKKLIRED